MTTRPGPSTGSVRNFINLFFIIAFRDLTIFRTTFILFS
jgi:hypothetical protein